MANPCGRVFSSVGTISQCVAFTLVSGVEIAALIQQNRIGDMLPSSDQKKLEQEAVSGSQRGDRDAFRYIVEAHSGLLFRTAFLILDEPSLAEDAVQETFIRAWRNIRSFKAGTAIRAWLIRILTNYLTSEYRRRTVPTTNIESAAIAPDHTWNPHRSAATNETNDQIWGAVMELNLEHRIAIVLRYFGHMSIPEIARSTGWREGTAKSRIHRALKEMRESDLSERLRVGEMAEAKSVGGSN